jgi:glycine betaine/proline transport system ATP-binding protein
MPHSSPAISCKGIWQVYGSNARQELERALSETQANAAATAKLLRQRGLVPAVADVSFDVAEGEVFVIMGLSG